MTNLQPSICPSQNILASAWLKTRTTLPKFFKDTSGPIFPIEIFAIIVDELAASFAADAHHISEGQEQGVICKLQMLQTCTLVCKAFTPFCRCHIFHSIDSIGFYGASFDPPPNRSLANLRRLIRALRENTALCSFVKQLHLVVETVERSGQDDDLVSGMITPGELMECNDIFARFRNLTRLSINYDEYQANDPAFRYPKPLTNMCSSLLHLYLNQGTVRGIVIRGVDNVELLDVFRSPLKELLVLYKTIPVFSLPTFYDLLSLEILDTLCLDFRGRGLLRTFIQFYLREGELANLKPFTRLSTLQLHLVDDDDYLITSSLLEHTLHLKSLIIWEYFTGDITVLRLHDIIPRVFPGITTLTLWLGERRVDSIVNPFVEYLNLLFSSIAGRNKITELVLYSGITYASNVLTSPSGNPWTELSAMLASPVGFPMLERATIKFSISGSTIVVDVIPDDFLDQNMSELKDRLGLNFVGRLSLYSDGPMPF
ncbi:hypothetical protein BJ165DRAFT_1523283 [Panaeolus papilionaceus]|nr:hypothetical protein BJ165DRAFT_1523283 [Panaeolus papilionaceus]